MITIIGTKQCRYCVACKEAYDAQGVEYEMVEILDDLQLLKKFINLRDTLPLYNGIQGTGKLGIPLIKDGDNYTREWKKYLPNKLINIVKAVIIKDGKILFENKKNDNNMKMICLPGFEIEPGEYLEEGITDYFKAKNILVSINKKGENTEIENEFHYSIKYYYCDVWQEVTNEFEWVDIAEIGSENISFVDLTIMNKVLKNY